MVYSWYTTTIQWSSFYRDYSWTGTIDNPLSELFCICGGYWSMDTVWVSQAI